MDEDEKVTGLCSVADVDPSEFIVCLTRYFHRSRLTRKHFSIPCVQFLLFFSDRRRDKPQQWQ